MKPLLRIIYRLMHVKCYLKMNAKDCDLAELIGCHNCDYSKSPVKGG